MNFKVVVKSLLGKGAIEFLKKFRDSGSMVVARLLVTSKQFAVFYYAVFNGVFSDEIYAVVAGRVAYKKSLTKVKRSSALLRRNTHRIEKGLIMEPRRPIFGTSFIEETIDCLERGLNSNSLDAEELKWIVDVHRRYFDVIENNPTTLKCKNKFSEIVKHMAVDNEKTKEYVPFSQHVGTCCAVSFQDLSDAMLFRKSVRWFEDRDVVLEQIMSCVDIAACAPSACNRQPYKFHISSSKSQAAQIASIAGGTNGFSHNIPCTIVVTGDLSFYPAERDRHLIYIDSSLMIMQFVLLLETLGLSSCLLNWTDIPQKEKQLRKILEIEIYERPIMMIAVGYAREGGGVPFSQKKNASTLVQEI